MRPTRALISTDAFLHNLKFVRQQIGPKPVIMAVIKANAYGHGLEIIANAAMGSGEVGYFGVATEEEGVALRKITTLPIQVLTTAMDNEIETFIANDLDFTVSDYHQLDSIVSIAGNLGKKANIHLKIDTGMRRIGIEPTDAVNFSKKIVSLSANINFVGISTHFATSDENRSDFFRKQVQIFSDAVRAVRSEGITVPFAHAANSGAILQLPKESSFDMVRPGIMLYGYAPSLEQHYEQGHNLQAVLDLVSAVGFTKRVARGEGVSYNLGWHADHDTNIATVAAGYGDGYSRSLTGDAEAIISDKRYPVRGTICMDQLMIETGNDEVRIGDDVTLISSHDTELSAWEIASRIGTIPYEVLTNITARVPRVVKENNT
ncbi:MAG TPA: alanine racemase [Candidatus Kapabacteria bacterium]|nr:alanine racemase [Candidatus Kapabacteria bacterium]